LKFHKFQQSAKILVFEKHRWLDVAERSTVADASDEDLQRLCLLEGLNVADASIEDLQKLLPQLRTYRILRS